MQTLKIDDVTARKMYPTAIPEIKTLLEQSFPKGFFSLKITDRVKDFNDILTISGRTMESVCGVRPGDTVDEIAYRKAKLIAEVYNESSILDPMDTNQRKYYPWHEIDPNSGSGLSYDDYDYWHSRSAVGVRLCFISEKLAEDAGRKFIDIYADLKIK